MLPVGAGEIILRELSSKEEMEREFKWYGQILSWGCDDLTTWAAREGDSEDKCALLNVFLWKQRHGLIDRNARIHAFLGPKARPSTYYIHRYMITNGYEGMLNGDDPYTHVGVNYLEEIGTLLDQWRASDFGNGELGFWDIVLLLNVLGPTLAAYERRSEVQTLAEYILKNHSVDPRLQRFVDDPELAAFTLLMWDLKMEPHRTWPEFQSLFLSRRKRSVMLYPGLIAGTQMYGNELREILRDVDLQGGVNLLFSLLDS